MNQLSTKVDEFEFLLRTEIDKTNLAEYIFDIYQESTEYEPYEKINSITTFIPSKLMIMVKAFDFFDEHCFHYAMNGNDEQLLSAINDDLEAGLLEEDIIENWREFRDYNNSYLISFPENCYESMFVRDINRAMNMHHLSYIKDDSKNTPYYFPEELRIEEWVNAPILGVW